MIREVTILCAILSLAGCTTHRALRNNTLNQTATWTDLQYQQVLDNVAMFTVNPSALPYFSIIGTGTTQVADAGSVSGGVTWADVTSGNLGGNATRQAAEQWSLATTTDPEKLEIMQCVYQYATGGMACDDCMKKIAQFYSLGKKKKPDFEPGDGEAEDISGSVEWEEWDRLRDIGPGWYHVGRKHDVPKDVCYVGHYCDTYVWVGPGGSDRLTKLTLAILDVATATSKSIEHYHIGYNAAGMPDHVYRFTRREPTPLLPSERDSLHALQMSMKNLPADNKDKRFADRLNAVNDALQQLRETDPQAHEVILSVVKGTITDDGSLRELSPTDRQKLEKLLRRLAPEPTVDGTPLLPGRMNYYLPQGLQYVPQVVP
jgi:hypothetical protein